MLACSYRGIHRRRSRRAASAAFCRGTHLFAAHTVPPAQPQGEVCDSDGAGKEGAAARTHLPRGGNRAPPIFVPVSVCANKPVSLSRCSRGTPQARVLIV